MSASDGLKMAMRSALGSLPAATEMITRLAEQDVALDRLDVVKLEEQVTLTNAAFTNLSATIPAGSVILAVASRLDQLIVGDGSGDNGLTKVGVGTSADPDLYGLSAALTANSKTQLIPAWTVLSGSTQVRVNAVNNSGTAVTEKFVAGGKVTVSIAYIAPKALPDV